MITFRNENVTCFVCVAMYEQDVGRGAEHESSGRPTDCSYKTEETLVLYDQSSRSVADDVAVSTSQMTSYHVVSVLLRRLKQDGFRVYLLDGKHDSYLTVNSVITGQIVQCSVGVATLYLM